jgi:hypothetical protein
VIIPRHKQCPDCGTSEYPHDTEFCVPALRRERDEARSDRDRFESERFHWKTAADQALCERDEARVASEAFKRELDQAVKNLQAALYREKENVRTINRYLSERDEARLVSTKLLACAEGVTDPKVWRDVYPWLRD